MLFDNSLQFSKRGEECSSRNALLEANILQFCSVVKKRNRRRNVFTVALLRGECVLYKASRRSPLGDRSKRALSLPPYPLLHTPHPLMNPVTFTPEVQQKISLLKARTSTPDNLRFLPPMKTAKDVIEFAKKCACTVFDLTFVDVPGTLQHTSKPVHELEGVLREGAGFDGSSIRGF